MSCASLQSSRYLSQCSARGAEDYVGLLAPLQNAWYAVYLRLPKEKPVNSKVKVPGTLLQMESTAAIGSPGR